tara:strand:+ start:5929 stop:7650 length:1722 start_codon:yes stop_codon:yes gene_type:complete
MNKFKNILHNLKFNQLFFLGLLIILLVVLSILELLSLGSIPVLLNTILEQKNIQTNFLDLNFLKDSFINLSKKKQVELISIIIICLFVFKNLFNALIFFFQGQLLKNIKIYISQKLFRYYLSQDYLLLIKKNTSVIQRILSIDVGNTIIYILSLLNLIKEVFILGAIIILLLLFNTEISLFLFSVFFVVASLFYYLNKKKIFIRGKEIQVLSSNLIKTIYETIGLFKELKIYDLKKFQFSNYLNRVKKTEKNIFLNYFITSLPRLFLELTAVILIVLIVLFQLHKDQNIINILPFLSLVVVVALRMIPIFNTLATSLSNLKAIQPSFDLIFSELNTIKLDLKNNDKSNFIEFKKNIFLKKISFKYKESDKNVINDLTLEISKGDKIGLIGNSGSGKSTLINIIMGLLKHTNGKIFIDDQEIHRDKNQFIMNIGYVPQEIFLFEDKLKKNIALGLNENEISMEKLLESSKAAQIIEVLDNLEDGFDTLVEENGRNFSVGQKQRIGVARALYRNPELLIFDESTSSLDKATERKFIDDVFSINKNKTIVFISHKMSTLDQCDKIFDIKKNTFIKL